ncbi:phospho-N-acetylmuramoyl-pentapeptide-transferase [Vibrio ishigakensis]|uniref:Phospho-N-acetylmuramoyl-pentapeptide-transferase n=1 Tax=Vibrio ishigakensis TaxID=1481914 RepID=A0A0B8NSR1_9VIBR|nr:phospho-N-acetylmuramoyl-pentapeptide-transferase [Vibrio ishigakensis]
MIIWLADLIQPYFSFFRLFDYLSFRSIMSILTALGISLWMGQD